MSENKRGWGLVGEENEETLIVEETDDEEETPSYTYDVKRNTVKEAAGMKPGKKQEEKIKLKPKEVISVLDKMFKEEKKELRKALEIEEEHLAWTSVERHRILRMEEQLSRGGAASSSSGPGTQGPITPNGGANRKVTAPVTKELPKHAREAALRDFRYELYQRQVKDGKFIPSRCSPTPTERQAACKHPYEHIKWTANQEGHYGRCRMCDLNHVLYFSDRHGALVSSQQKLEEIYVSGICPGQAIADTGCRTAVGGGADDYWEQPEVKRLKDVLVRMPHTFAFEPSEGAGDAGLEDELLADLEAELGEFPTCDIEEPGSVEDREGEDEDRCSSTSHEFGIEVFTESGSENSDEEKEDAAEDIDVMVAGNTKSFSKSMRSKCGRAAREIRKAGEDEVRRRQQQPQQPQDPCLRPSSLPLRKRWKVLEVFTWTCCISMMALERGWHMCEPVTLPGWDLRDPQTREEAHNYIDSQAPDLLVLAWPCSPWSSLQNLNCRTPEAVRRLAQKRKEHRPMLEFVREAVRRQRARGGAVLGENPRLSKAWQEPAIEVVIGAEEYLRGTRRPDIFVEGAHVPEERFEEFENEEEVVPEEDLEQRMLQEELMEVSREEEAPEEAQRQQKQTRDRLRLMMVHRRLGHPSPETLERMLRLAGADGQLLKECRELQCPVCEASQAPRKPMQQAPSMRPVTFNASMHLDLKYAKDCKSKLYVALSMIDHATNFHRACLLRTRRPAHVANKFVTQWCALFGNPTELVFDQGGEFEKEFLFELEKRAIHSKVVGAYAPWQNSFAERQGALLGAAWHALIVEYKAEDWTVMKQSLAAAVQAKNATVSRRGYSANALVFGRPANFPDLLDDDVQDRTTLGQALNLEGEFSRAMEMRAAARRALLHQDVQAKLKKALLRRPGGEAIPFLPGQRIYFWVPGPKNVRYKKDRSGWRGPATVMVREGEEWYFVSWRGRCLLLSAANMRPATAEEAGDMVRLELDAQEAIQELEKMKSFQDATSWRPRKVIRHPLFKRRQKQKQQLKQKAPEEKPIVPEPLGGVDVPVPEGGSDYEPTSPRSSASQDFWPTVQQIEKWYDEIDDEVISDHSGSPRVRRRRSLDDVPDPIRQKRSPDEQLSEEQIRKKFKGEFFQTVMVATAVEEFQDKYKGKANLPSKEQGKANAWLPRSEVKKLRRLLDMPITAARLHKQPRKRMQRPPHSEERREAGWS
ncbi:unnamed protein product [Effrenium voratum]|nr:unnamed protein product [Effrenium voratum]